MKNEKGFVALALVGLVALIGAAGSALGRGKGVKAPKVVFGENYRAYLSRPAGWSTSPESTFLDEVQHADPQSAYAK